METNIIKINLSLLKSVKEFFAISSNCKEDIILRSFDGKYCVDGKSLLGIFSLDLSQPLILETTKTDAEEVFKKFIEE